MKKKMPLSLGEKKIHCIGVSGIKEESWEAWLSGFLGCTELILPMGDQKKGFYNANYKT